MAMLSFFIFICIASMAPRNITSIWQLPIWFPFLVASTGSHPHSSCDKFADVSAATSPSVDATTGSSGSGNIVGMSLIQATSQKSRTVADEPDLKSRKAASSNRVHVDSSSKNNKIDNSHLSGGGGHGHGSSSKSNNSTSSHASPMTVMFPAGSGRVLLQDFVQLSTRTVELIESEISLWTPTKKPKDFFNDTVNLLEATASKSSLATAGSRAPPLSPLTYMVLALLVFTCMTLIVALVMSRVRSTRSNQNIECPPPPPPHPTGSILRPSRREQSSLRLPSAAVARATNSACAPCPWPQKTPTVSSSPEPPPSAVKPPTLLVGGRSPYPLVAEMQKESSFYVKEKKSSLDAQQSQAKAEQQAEIEFCPDLVVPSGCECVLLAPVRPLNLGPYDVCDPNGHVVLRVMPRPTLKRQQFQIELLTGSGDFLAQARVAEPTPKSVFHDVGSKDTEFHLLRSNGAYFATLQRDEQDNFHLVTGSGKIFFWGSFDHHAVNITDSTGNLLATTELSASDFDPCGEYYRLRAAPLVDVGLLLCSLICIDMTLLTRRS
eukprot:TRINITY_DN18384_c0_g1_i1.p1 TRINITY_DN18384_c0_g1~~TRINITY_DN18384_c0_g1_i1.p1  ORF type:complete len:549 (-),score=77.45 TRINITY_DN18384_c0_g1_i1:288-1934(-)